MLSNESGRSIHVGTTRKVIWHTPARTKFSVHKLMDQPLTWATAPKVYLLGGAGRSWAQGAALMRPYETNGLQHAGFIAPPTLL